MFIHSPCLPQVGATVPDRWCYEAMANKKDRAKLTAKADVTAQPYIYIYIYI